MTGRYAFLLALPEQEETDSTDNPKGEYTNPKAEYLKQCSFEIKEMTFVPSLSLACEVGIEQASAGIGVEAGLVYGFHKDEGEWKKEGTTVTAEISASLLAASISCTLQWTHENDIVIDFGVRVEAGLVGDIFKLIVGKNIEPVKALAKALVRHVNNNKVDKSARKRSLKKVILEKAKDITSFVLERLQAASGMYVFVGYARAFNFQLLF